MKRLYIVVEGQTEETFVKEMLAPYINSKLPSPIVINPTIVHTSKTGRGGGNNYEHYKNDVKRFLKAEANNRELLVSMFLDFFRCPTNMPRYTEWSKLPSKAEQVRGAEQAMAEDINDSRFIPYIQLHEFEALLFSSGQGFDEYFKTQSQQLKSIVNQYANPEDINTTPNGAPSKRIEAIIPEYDKVAHGNILALEIGIEPMLERCPHFRSWVEALVERCQP